MRVSKIVFLALIGVMVPFLSPAAFAKTLCSVTDSNGTEFLEFKIPVETPGFHSNAIEKKLADTEIDAYSEFSQIAKDECATSSFGLRSTACRKAAATFSQAAEAHAGEKLDLVLNAIQQSNVSSTSAGLLVTPKNVTDVRVTTELGNIVTRIPCEFSIQPGITKSCLIQGQGIPTFKLTCIGI